MNIIKKTITKMKIKKSREMKKYILTIYKQAVFFHLLDEGEILVLFNNYLIEYYIRKHIELDKNKWIEIYINSKDFLKKMKKENNASYVRKFSKRFLRRIK